MEISRMHNLIRQISLICHQKKAFRILVQTSHRVYSGRIMNQLDYIHGPVLVRSSADHSPRLIYSQQNRLYLFFPGSLSYRFTVAYNRFLSGYFFSHSGLSSVNGHFSCFNQAIRLPAGTNTLFT